MANMNTVDSISEKNIMRGIEKELISFNEDKSRITYTCARSYSTSFKNPEESVRAAYFVELVLDYLYPSQKIDI